MSDSPFILPGAAVPIADAPEALFSLLTKQDRRVQQLWSHQADALRAFMETPDSPDIAIELPTGSGKTLVALLLAEWLRRTKGARVLYLCPDNALVHQVREKAEGYGIAAVGFTGSAREYDAADVARFNASEAIGITSYFTVFNANPRLDPTHLILDDAHSAGGAIASNWTVEITRREHPDAFQAVVDLFSGWISGDLRSAIEREVNTRQISLIPTPVLLANAERLAETLDAHLVARTAPTFAWSNVRDHLGACNLFVSQRSVVLRPYIPPTHSLPVFSNAKQRIYLSATLGRDGDLERTVGRAPIRLVPSTLKGSIGRRFILFGDAGLEEAEQDALFASLLSQAERVVILTPSDRDAEEFASRSMVADPTRSILRNDDIRVSYAPFTTASRAALVLANRYDGIDLPDETCRTLILSGLPYSGDLQERFLWEELGAHGALWERMTTRLSQGLGRTARGFQDYTLAILYGEDVLDFVTNSSRIGAFNPVLAAELRFAARQIPAPIDQRIRAIEVFVGQDAAWQQINQYLVGEVGSIQAAPASNLATIVTDEVKYGQALWDMRYSTAAQHAKTVADALMAAEHRGYRAWWCLALSGAAHLSSREDPTYAGQALAALEDGRQTNANGRVFALARAALPGRTEVAAAQQVGHSSATDHADAVDRLVGLLGRLGYNSTKFESRAKRLLDRLRDNAASSYETGLAELGEWLGFRSWRPNVEAAPDAIWYLSELEVLALEAKSEKTSDTLSFAELREAAGHAAWLRSNDRTVAAPATTIDVLVASPCASFDSRASEFATQLLHLSLDEILELGESAVSQLRTLRIQIANAQQQDRARELCTAMLAASDIAPSKVLAQLRTSRMIELLTAS